MSCNTADKLNSSRKSLLDLTTRSRLIHQPRGRAKIVEVVDELGEETFQRLVVASKKFSFLPVPTRDDEDAPLSILDSEDEPEDERGVAARHTDLRLQTTMEDEKLQKRLRQMDYDARSFEEEQGVNILFLAIGFLEWYESDSSDKARSAPLILVPVRLERRSANQAYKISFTDEDLHGNLSLQEKLKADFGVTIPDFADAFDAGDSSSPTTEYANAVTEAVSRMKRWRVRQDDIVLGFYSFAKFMMYRDLDPASWPESDPLEGRALVDGLLCSGFSEGGDPFGGEDVQEVDAIASPEDSIHVVDADSSQTVAIEVVRRGCNLVIQGPPGTGKSQTITNLIAGAVADGKTVLFVAEKMAALSVVRSRMEQLQLGPLCLELHSHKARKKELLQDLSQTWSLGAPTLGPEKDSVRKGLKQRRQALDAHVARMHEPLSPSQLTPFRLVGELVRIRRMYGTLPAIVVEGSNGWGLDRFETLTALVARLSGILEEMPDPAAHPWRGTELTSVLPDESVRFAARAGELREALQAVEAFTSELTSLLNVEGSVQTLGEVSALLSLGRALLDAPAVDRESVCSPVWESARDDLRRVVQAGKDATQARAHVGRYLTDAAWEKDLSEERQAIHLRRDSLFRIFSSSYRTAMSRIKSLGKEKLRLKPAVVVHMLDRIPLGHRAEALVAELDQQGQEAFGTVWKGARSDFDSLSASLEWIEAAESKIHPQVRRALATDPDLGQLKTLTDQVGSSLSDFETGLPALLGDLKNSPDAIWGNEPDLVPIGTITSLLAGMAENAVGLNQWIQYNHLRTEITEQGLQALIRISDDGQAQPDALPAVLANGFYQSLFKSALESRPELTRFRGLDHERIISEFQELDHRRIQHARVEVAAAHHARIPPRSGLGQPGILLKQMGLKRRHMPIRRLMREAGEAVQAIKPVFMMSPLSIAQYLEPGGLSFDLVIMDEASQIQPVEALGAIARGHQLVVVGDEQQLPPTRFFDKIADAEESEDPDEVVLGNIESVLGLCSSQGMPDRMLMWHYRSRHESLIAVSNQEFYRSKLFIVPSSGIEDDVGLRFRPVDGIWDRGRSATNRIEARAVVQAVMRHAADRPDLSLGVGTFSASQRDAVLDELELARRAEPSLESFFSTGGAEPFFVKNLESLQGDERDVIFISVGYARDADGYFTMNFGPVGMEGGERRLNVLMSRARRRTEVFASITGADIDLARAKSRGAKVLKTFLRYAELGELEGYLSPGDREPDSPFEEDVGRALTDLGHSAHHQVGEAGFFIDLAVVDPTAPGRYLLGIECDGATYHSSRSARERDRLRQEVLESRGWTVHRIWSTDWFQDSEGELRKLEGRIQELLAGVPEPARPGVEDPPASIWGEPSTEAETDDLEAGPYREADFSVSSPFEPHEAPNKSLASVVERIVAIEAPIHGDELGRRLATVWGKGRAGARIREAASRGAGAALRQGLIERDGDFWTIRVLQKYPARSRRNVTSTTLRKGDMIAPQEIRGAIYSLVEANHSVATEELLSALARVFGFDRLGHDLRLSFEKQLRWMLGQNELSLADGRLTLG